MRYTRFEKARLIGARSLQISDGAYLTVDTERESSLDIAKEEFEKGKIPLVAKPKKRN
ncbi:MAG TPA: DNA-directed RNA polymerase subunit K [Methanothermococcus okinawensis]|uniref:DNA-directed RNA polymerase subunit K n=1 Tax=Methanofervidicoccus abyssi TaxID=2082189 RepID=A0A401HPH5_9EURY|nr:DNA-directed RNA polymerase subunit K [Methanofervidicoccus abyssi]GBF36130.1 DNA-directed RNA polymerase subunit K [Methanofervidicoccus abyssi]HIP15821.1 DNA-directed RNA polymerase subunit K [Methanothermococcus okinawensis]HIP34717.1 DNA-directed RNA polymerase subunit K [Methanothermococcus okinawensis]